MALYLFLGIYILIIFGISYFINKRTDKEDDYLIGGRNRSGIAILASKFAGAVGVSTFITYTGYAYRFGWGVFAILVGSVTGYTLFALWAAPKIKRISAKGNFYTQGDLAGYITGSRKASLITNYVSVLVQFFWVVLSLAGGAKIIAYFEIMPYSIALVTTSAVVLVYVLFSGFSAVIVTDLFQAVIVLLFLGVIVSNFLDANIVETVQSVPAEKVKAGGIAGFLLYGILSVFGLADRYQLCYAANNENAAKKGMGFAVIPILTVAFLLLMVGLSVLSVKKGLDPDTVFVYAMQNQLNKGLLPVVLVMFFAGLMSSADTSIFAVASHAVLFGKAENKVKSVRFATVVVVVLATILALFWTSIINITIVGAALKITLAVPMIYIILNKKNHRRFIGSIAGGIIGLTGGFLAFGADPKIALTVLIGSLLGLLVKGNSGKKQEKSPEPQMVNSI